MNEKKLEKCLKALANRRRLAMLGYLKRTHEATVSRVAFEMGLSIRATSRHLLVLERGNILNRAQRNIEVFYSISGELEDFVREIISQL